MYGGKKARRWWREGGVGGGWTLSRIALTYFNAGVLLHDEFGMNVDKSKNRHRVNQCKKKKKNEKI